MRKLFRIPEKDRVIDIEYEAGSHLAKLDFEFVTRSVEDLALQEDHIKLSPPSMPEIEPAQQSAAAHTQPPPDPRPMCVFCGPTVSHDTSVPEFPQPRHKGQHPKPSRRFLGTRGEKQ